jgi:Phage integrase family
VADALRTARRLRANLSEHDGQPWSEAAYQSWRRRAFAHAHKAAGVEHARLYDLRHSFASPLLHEGRSVIYVAPQLGHGAQLTLGTYGHVVDELDESPRLDAEDAIAAAREGAVAPQLPITRSELSAQGGTILGNAIFAGTSASGASRDRTGDLLLAKSQRP